MRMFVKAILVVLLYILSSCPANAQLSNCFQPHYSSYTSYTIDGSYNATQTVTVSGYTTINQACLTLMTQAHHYPKVTNLIGATGGQFTGPQFCPSCQMYWQNSVTATLVPGDAPVDGEADSVFICTVGGNIGGGSSSSFELEGAKTRESSTGVLSNCHWLTGPLQIEDCDIGSVPYCTLATSPPDMHLSPTEWQVFPTPAPNFWDTIAICARFGGTGHPWTCTKGLATPLAPTPALLDCTHNP